MSMTMSVTVRAIRIIMTVSMTLSVAMMSVFTAMETISITRRVSVTVFTETGVAVGTVSITG